jgi:hypothetical protein
MAQWDSGNLSTTGYGYFYIRLYATENPNQGGNYSTVSWSLYLYGNNNSFHANYPHISSYYVNIGGYEYGDSVTYDFAGAGGAVYLGGTTTGAISHNADGSKSISVYASFSGADGYPLGDGNTGWQGMGLTDFPMPPYATSTPTYTPRVSGNNSVTISTGGSTYSGDPGIDYYRYHILNRNTNTWSTVDTGSPYTFAGDYSADYYVYTTAHNSAGFGPDSSGTEVYAAPYISSVTLPSGTVGKTYSGSIIGTKVDSYSISSGSLPAGLSISGSSIVGTPTIPGVYTFTLRGTRTGVGTYDFASQTVQVFAGGPWVYLSSPWTSKTVTAATTTGGATTVTTSAAHNISELNQPITLSGFSGAQAFLNGNWVVSSWTSNTLTFTTGASNQSATGLSGTVATSWKRTSISAYPGGVKTQGYTRVWNGSSWVNTA